jgi:hypothetical protein
MEGVVGIMKIITTIVAAWALLLVTNPVQASDPLPVCEEGQTTNCILLE